MVVWKSGFFQVKEQSHAEKELRKLVNLLRRFSFLYAIQMTIGVMLAFFGGSAIALWFSLGDPRIAGLWCGISTVLVLGIDIKKAHNAAWLRLVGSFLGCVIAGVLVTFFGYQIWVLCLSIFLVTALDSALNLKYAIRLACITILVVIVIGMMSEALPPWKNAFARFLESALGIGIGILLSWIFYPLRHHFKE